MLVQRLAILAAVFGCELAATTILLDAESLPSAGLPGLIRLIGPLTLRVIVGFVALFLAVAFLKSGAALRAISGEAALCPLRPSFLAAHVGMMAAFGLCSATLFGGRAGNGIAVAWLAAGTAGVVLGAYAFLPGRLWRALLARTDYAWAYAAVAVALAASAEQAGRALWPPAAALTFRLVRIILQPFVTVILADPVSMAIQTTRFRVFISPECSGLEGAGLMLAFGATLLWVLRDECRFPQSFILLPGGIVLLFLLNAVRIAGLVMIGDAGARQIAAGGFHSQAGWIAFNSVALGLAAALRSVPWFTVRSAAVQTKEKFTDNPTAAYLMPFLAILASGMLSRAVTGTFEWAYPVRFAAAVIAIWVFRRAYRSLDWRFGWLSMGAGLVVFGMWVVLDRVGKGSSTGVPVVLAAASPWLRLAWITVRVLAATLTVPVAEELAFRGYVLRRLVAADFEQVPWNARHWVALAVSSIAFGALHSGRWLAGGVAGVAYGLTQWAGGRLGDAVAAHATTNALLACYVLYFDQWQFW